MKSVALAASILVASFATSATAFAPPSSSIVNSHATATLATRHQRSDASSTTTTVLSMAITLYGSQGSRSPLVNWAADELNVELKAGDLSKNPHPFGQIPCLTDDNDVTVFESGAILNYLQSVADGGKGISEGGKKSAEVASWISWANASLDPICFLETPEGKVYDTGLKSPNRRIEKLNSILSDSPYLVDGKFTLADVAVASYLLYVIQFFPDVDLYSKWPHVVRYMKDCAEREGYGKAFGSNVQGFCVGRLEQMMEGGGKEKKLFGMF